MELPRGDHDDAYQAHGRAWSPARADVDGLLRAARHVESYPIYYGSNHTFLVTVCSPAGDLSLAVYKPARGEYPLHDFPSGTLYRREVATWHLDRLLGWTNVPPTVVSTGEYGPGSLQLYIDGRETMEIEIGALRRVAILDFLANNADRKLEHCLPDQEGHIWAIDHGLTFHVQPKLRTFLWHFAGSPLTRSERRHLEGAAHGLIHADHGDAIRELLSAPEWSALRQRIERVLDAGRLPDPRYKPVPYRW
ncbi:MAG TPA: hypothetical protein VFB58_08485 [Chloroflexota bacterium]|nr:hypothetical protein [Chloroflexota bacterium]